MRKAVLENDPDSLCGLLSPLILIDVGGEKYFSPKGNQQRKPEAKQTRF